MGDAGMGSAETRLPQDQVAELTPAATTPAGIEAKCEAAAVAKAALPTGRMFVLAMLAGAFISFGAAFFVMLLGDTTLTFAAQRCLGGLCFCLGLVLVLCCGAELFTGNCLMITGVLSHKVGWGAMFKNWVVVWLGNFAGALLVMFLIYMASLQTMNGGAVGEQFVSVALGKATLAPTTMLFKGIMCNIFVCLAVWIGFAARNIVDKVVGILLPISAFVAMGFEHSVANMFFLSMGIVCKDMGGFGAALANVDALNVATMLLNIGVVTLGNIIGGSIFVGPAYWFCYHKR